jgi:hypothetical protein
LEPNQGKNPIYTLDYWWKLVLQILDFFSCFTIYQHIFISHTIYISFLTFNFLMNMKNMNGNYMLQPSPMQTINLLDFIGSELGGLCISGCITTTVFSNCYLGLNLFCKLN